ncbi:MAG: M28 family peptidase [Acidobacteriota bacterium]
MGEKSNRFEFLEKNLKDHVVALSHEIGERSHHHYESLEKAAEYIFQKFEDHGYTPEKHTYKISGTEYGNIIATRTGRDEPYNIIVAGAHYDTVRGTPGANDNASGVSAVLELSRLFSTIDTRKTIRFIAFVNEEPPFFRTRLMGSRVYTRQAKKNNENILAMLSFEMIGYYSEKDGSQHYPFGIRLSHPREANFIAIVGDLRSRRFVRECARIFRKHSNFDIQSVSVPRFIPGVDFSDHWSFWKEGYRAAMVTDTAFYRYDDYHTSHDTFEKLGYGKMAQVVEGFYHVLAELGE